MKLWCYKVLPCQRKDLSVEIVYCGGDKEEAAQPPAPITLIHVSKIMFTKLRDDEM